MRPYVDPAAGLRRFSTGVLSRALSAAFRERPSRMRSSFSRPSLGAPLSRLSPGRLRGVPFNPGCRGVPIIVIPCCYQGQTLLMAPCSIGTARGLGMFKARGDPQNETSAASDCCSCRPHGERRFATSSNQPIRPVRRAGWQARSAPGACGHVVQRRRRCSRAARSRALDRVAARKRKGARKPLIAPQNRHCLGCLSLKSARPEGNPEEVGTAPNIRPLLST